MLIQIITIILGAILLVILAFVFYLRLQAIREYRKGGGNTPSDPKEEWLIGKVGIVKTLITPDHPGKIHVQGAYWNAISDSDTFDVGEKVEVVSFRKSKLVVSSAKDKLAP